MTHDQQEALSIADRMAILRAGRILQVGTSDNKNLLRVAAALEGICCRLVIIGALSSEQVDALTFHGINYETHTDLSREQMVDAYVRADLLLFASTYEGFGLPIVEANAVGRPVITSQVSAMPEVAGDAACLVDPHDVMSIRRGVLRVMDDPAYRQALVDRGLVNARRFQAASIAHRYLDVYRSVAATLT